MPEKKDEMKKKPEPKEKFPETVEIMDQRDDGATLLTDVVGRHNPGDTFEVNGEFGVTLCAKNPNFVLTKVIKK